MTKKPLIVRLPEHLQPLKDQLTHGLYRLARSDRIPTFDEVFLSNGAKIPQVKTRVYIETEATADFDAVADTTDISTNHLVAAALHLVHKNSRVAA